MMNSIVIIGVSDVHGVGDGMDGGYGGEGSGFPVIEKRMIGVVGGNKFMDGESHGLSPESSGEVAKVSGGNRKN